MNTGTVVVRVPEESRDSLKSVASAMGLTMQELLVSLIAEAENRLFFSKMALGLEEMRQDPECLASEQKSLDVLSRADADGLEEAANVTKGQTRRNLASQPQG
jgi:hypothetical protein